LKELWDYTQYHFDTEETLMNELGYPSTTDHLNEHMVFMTKISEIKANKDKKIEDEDMILMEIVNFLSNWLYGHILTIDKKL
jgi:hemerythrin